ncbi:beta-N-acetylhexosaminidase [Pseudomonas sp. T]|nr:beta-N-acetylhexosaminidase [Pseudomonas sp. T]
MIRLNRTTLAAAIALSMLAFASASQAQQQTVDQLSRLKLQVTVKDNHAADNGIDCAALGADWASCNLWSVTLTSDSAIQDKDWAIYFHNPRQVLKTLNDQFKVTFVTGDLHRIEPTEKFTGFAAGQSVEIPLIGEYWQLFESDIMPRWYATAPDAQPKVIASTDTEKLRHFVTPFTGDLWKRTAADHNVLMLPGSRFERNADLSVLPAANLRGQIIPTPQNVKIFDEDVDLSAGVNLTLDVLDEASAAAVQQRFTLLGVKTLKSGYPINTSIAATSFKGRQAVSGAYQLVIGAKKTEVRGYDQAGVFHGLQSILSLLPADGSAKIAQLEARDAPRFAYRGVQLDIGRNFHSKAAVERLLDQMAAYKLNKFHFHLTDDEGWRLEIPGLPELTEVGARRCHDLSEKTCLLPQLGSGPNPDNNGSGFLTRADYIEIVRYAKARQIEVIPEIDMPAHTRAALISMEARHDRLLKAGDEKGANEFRLLDPTDTSNTTSVQFYDRRSYLNPCLDSSKRFVDKIIGEVARMHAEAGQPLATWHFGGDEAKNIRLGPGYQDKGGKLEPGKGIVDQSVEDKPWARSQACQALIAKGEVADLEHLPSHFAIEVSQMVKRHGIDGMQAWQDGLKDAKDAKAFATRRVAVNFWDTLYWGGFDTANDWANKGYEVIISNPDYVYLDFPAEVNPQENGYYWGTRYSDERKVFSFAPDNLPQNAETSVDRDGTPFTAKSDKPWPGAYGLSAQLWSETTRTDEMMEYKLYPRLLSVAERAWHRAGWEQDYQAGREYKGGETHWIDAKALHGDWQRFANLIGQRELAKLDKAGVGYRLPVPGAKVIGGKLEANSALPGLGIEYTIDGGQHWQSYDVKTQPKVSSTVQVRSVSPDGKRHSREEPVDN